MATVVFGDCEWDDGKAAENLAKHGVSFQEAATALADVDMRVFDDGSGAGRVVAIGFSAAARVLAVVHVERGVRDRIISARRATVGEARLYREG